VIVYLLTSPSGKQYVGQTTGALARRLSLHRYGKNIIGRAVRKHGLDAFRVDVLAKASSKETLDRLERRAISGFGTLVPAGYNLAPGGDGVSAATREKLRRAHLGRKMTSESRRKMSEAARKRWARPEERKRAAEQPHPPLTPESRRKMSESLRATVQRQGSHWTGRRHTAESRRKMSEAQKKRAVREGRRLK
jgi:group I intron endonuclease